MRFTEQLWSYALPLRATAENAHRAGIVGDNLLNHAWQSLPEAVRREVVKELSPYFAENPALTFLPFNRCSDLRDISIADDDYRCAEPDRDNGIERLRVEIGWGDFTDKKIIRAFRIWIKENRPPGFGQAHKRGKRKSAGFSGYLAWVGILRLMHTYPFTSARRIKQEAWMLYRSADWPRARKSAARLFHELFPFLPRNDTPIHWKTAGGRGR